MKTDVTISINTDNLPSFTDQYLAQLWHIAQANPAPYGDKEACELASAIGFEIIRRFVASQGPELYNHQADHRWRMYIEKYNAKVSPVPQTPPVRAHLEGLPGCGSEGLPQAGDPHQQETGH